MRPKSEEEKLRDRIDELFIIYPTKGEVYWAVNKGRAKKGQKAGYRNSRGDLIVRFDKKIYRLNRIIYLYVKGKLPERIYRITKSKDISIQNLGTHEEKDQVRKTKIRKTYNKYWIYTEEKCLGPTPTYTLAEWMLQRYKDNRPLKAKYGLNYRGNIATVTEYYPWDITPAEQNVKVDRKHAGLFIREWSIDHIPEHPWYEENKPQYSKWKPEVNPDIPDEPDMLKLKPRPTISKPHVEAPWSDGSNRTKQQKKSLYEQVRAKIKERHPHMDDPDLPIDIEAGMRAMDRYFGLVDEPEKKPTIKEIYERRAEEKKKGIPPEPKSEKPKKPPKFTPHSIYGVKLDYNTIDRKHKNLK